MTATACTGVRHMLRRLRGWSAPLSPKALRFGLSRVGGLALDYRFERSSPIPRMPEPWVDAIESNEIVLPPPRVLMQPGNQTIDGLLFLVSLAKTLDARHVMEIGTYNGLTTWCFARNLPRASVHTLDLLPEESPALDLDPTDHDFRREFPGRYYETLGTAERVTQLWGDSATYDFGPFLGKCDFVYVDGSHSASYVAKDTDNALRIVSRRGAIVWDDYWRHTPGVKQVLDARTDLELFRVGGTRLVFHLRPHARRTIVEAASVEPVEWV
jgi:predicted O-methyltransferase YrrM